MRRVVIAAAVVACHHSATPSAASSFSSPAAGPVAGADTLRGIVAITGATPLTHLVLRPAGGGPAVPLSGDSAAAMRALSGLDVWVQGTAGATSFAVTRFRVRAAGGVPAVDGTLAVNGGAVVLITDDGARHALTAAPPEFASHPGARAWVTLAADQTVITFGLLPSP